MGKELIALQQNVTPCNLLGYPSSVWIGGGNHAALGRERGMWCGTDDLGWLFIYPGRENLIPLHELSEYFSDKNHSPIRDLFQLLRCVAGRWHVMQHGRLNLTHAFLMTWIFQKRKMKQNTIIILIWYAPERKYDAIFCRDKLPTIFTNYQDNLCSLSDF